MALNWRDITHPEGGGSERYIEEVCAGLARLGHTVTLVCADHGRAPQREIKNGVRYLRTGHRFTVYPNALRELFWGTLGKPDAVLDVSNGVPFFSPVVRRTPTIGIVHHVHREQWDVVMGPRLARIGWFIESEIAPRIYRHIPVVAVSNTTRQELRELGFGADIKVIHNGTQEIPAQDVAQADRPTLMVLGRLVPHKRVEDAMTAAAQLRHVFPGLQLWVVGSGWHEAELLKLARRNGLLDVVEFTGFVTDAEKHRRLAQAWVHLCPSVKEGWGLSVMEAALHGVPTVAYHGAGALSESIVDQVTGLLAEPGVDHYTHAVQRLLADADLRSRLGTAAHDYASQFTWGRTVAAFDQYIEEVIAAWPHRPPVHDAE